MRSCLGASWTRPLSKQRSEVVANESLRRRPRRLQLLLLLTPSRPPASARASRRRARVADMARRLQASPSRLRIRKLNLRASLTSQRRRVLAIVGMGVGVGTVRHSPREMCFTSPPPQVGARLLQFYHKWALVTENWFVLKVIWVGASLVFPVQPPLSDSCVPFSLHHEGNPKRDALMAKGW